MGKKCWSWLFIDPETGKCSECEAFIGTPCPTNNKAHLNSKHQLSHNCEQTLAKEKEATAKLNTPKIRETFDKVASDSRFLDYMLMYAIPLHRTEDELFRSVHPTAPATAVTLRTRILDHAKRRQDECLKGLNGKTCTIAIDGGTIWNKYLSIVCLVYGRAPLVVGCVHCKESMTTEWTLEQIARTVKILKDYNVTSCGIVADNASNMQSALGRCGLLQQRCLAHTIQLAVNDCFGIEPFCSSWETTKTIMKDNKLAEPPLTRWSGKYFMMTEVTNLEKEYTVTVAQTEYAKLLPAAYALRPFWQATQRVQGMKATMLTAAAVIYSLSSLGGRDTYQRALNAATKKRMDMLLTDGVLIACYFHPGTKRHELDAKVRDYIFGHAKTTMKTIVGDKVLAEFLELRTQPPLPMSPLRAYNTTDYIEYWGHQSHSFPTLAEAIIKIVAMNPTEAECERAFSTCKFAFNRLRTRSSGDLVEATVLGGSAVAHKTNHTYIDVEAPPPKHEDVADEDNVAGTLRGIDASTLLNLWASQQADAPARAPRHRQEEQNLCGICHGDSSKHKPGALWCACSTCMQWFAFECVGIADADQPIIKAMEWFCNDCRNYNPRAEPVDESGNDDSDSD